MAAVASFSAIYLVFVFQKASDNSTGVEKTESIPEAKSSKPVSSPTKTADREDTESRKRKTSPSPTECVDTKIQKLTEQDT